MIANIICCILGNFISEATIQVTNIYLLPRSMCLLQYYVDMEVLVSIIMADFYIWLQCQYFVGVGSLTAAAEFKVVAGGNQVR